MLRRFQEADQSRLLRAVLCDGSDTNLHEAGVQGGEPKRQSGVGRGDEVIITCRDPCQLVSPQLPKNR